MIFIFRFLQVTWGQMGNALNMKWAGACGSPLTDDNLYYLACKALRNNNLPRLVKLINYQKGLS